ncbi:MAG: glycosyl hydrolase [Chitinophagales bacterium]|nr:glycosyl hydrolase [Chitinophagales bacterium]
MKKIVLAAFLLVAVKITFGQSIDPKIFGDIKARQIGPAVMSGRMTCIDVVNSKTNTIYIGSAGGGVWKSLNYGVTFKPLFDKYTQSIGAIAIDQKHPDTVWAGSGESWTRNSVSVGTGIYVTYDGGTNWKKMGLDSTERISKIRIDPRNPNVIYVAVPGHLWNDDANRGVYKTNDGGKSWSKILYTDVKTGCADLDIDPSNPDIVYAAMWQFRRTPYSFASGGPGSGLYKSTDGGKNWKKLSNGIPNETLGRCAIAVSPANPKVVYATIEYSKSAMFRSSDHGESWKRLGTTQAIIERPFYFARLVPDPVDTNVIYRMGLNMVVSKDGGNSFSTVGGGAHGDFHDLWIDAKNNQNLVFVTDGGCWLSFDRGRSARFCHSVPVGQFYHVMYDMETPYNVYGGLQDNFSWYGPSQTNTGGISEKYWSPVGGGDGFWTMPDRSDSKIVYAESQGGEISRFDRSNKTFKQIKPYASANEQKYRFNWNAAISTSPNNIHKLYLGGQYLFVSYDKGETWKKLSPDLSTNNPKEQQQESSGGITADNSSAENHNSIYTIAESPIDSNVIWVGTDDGNIQVTTNAGKTWTNVVSKAIAQGVPKEGWVSTIEASHYNKGTAYAAIDNHSFGDMKPYVYKTTDYGQSWTKISNDSVKGYAFTVREDVVNPNLLFIGTEFGLFVSIDGGQQWSQLTNNIPNVAIRDMIIHPRDKDLILATHGRALMIIDGYQIDLLRQLNPDVMQAKIKVLKTPPYTIPVQGFDIGYLGDEGYAGANPDQSPIIAYYLSARHLVGDFKIQVLDDKGAVISDNSAGKRKGINVVKLNLNRKLPKVPPAPLGAFGAAQGPDLGEGTYPVRIIKNKDTVMTSITVIRDAKSPYTAEDRASRKKTMMQLYDMLNSFAYTVDGITSMSARAKSIADSLPAKDKLKATLQSFSHALDTLHESVVYMKPGLIIDQNARLRDQLANAYGSVIFFDGRPNNSVLDQVGTLQQKMDNTEKTYQKILSDYLSKINARLKADKMKEIARETKADFDKAD